MPKCKTKNIFHSITWEVHKVCYWNFASLCLIIKTKISSKTSAKIAAWKLVLGPFSLAKN